MYAVNLADMTQTAVVTAAQMLVQPVAVPDLVKVGPNPDDMAVALNCDEQRAKAICAILNSKRTLVRCYVQGSRGGWTRLRNEDLRAWNVTQPPDPA